MLIGNGTVTLKSSGSFSSRFIFKGVVADSGCLFPISSTRSSSGLNSLPSSRCVISTWNVMSLCPYTSAVPSTRIPIAITTNKYTFFIELPRLVNLHCHYHFRFHYHSRFRRLHLHFHHSLLQQIVALYWCASARWRRNFRAENSAGSFSEDVHHIRTAC